MSGMDRDLGAHGEPRPGTNDRRADKPIADENEPASRAGSTSMDDFLRVKHDWGRSRPIAWIDAPTRVLETPRCHVYGSSRENLTRTSQTSVQAGRSASEWLQGRRPTGHGPGSADRSLGQRQRPGCHRPPREFGTPRWEAEKHLHPALPLHQPALEPETWLTCGSVAFSCVSLFGRIGSSECQKARKNLDPPYHSVPPVGRSVELQSELAKASFFGILNKGSYCPQGQRVSECRPLPSRSPPGRDGRKRFFIALYHGCDQLSTIY